MAEELDLEGIDPDEHDNPNVVRQLRDGLKSAKKEASEGLAAKRELAFLKAGVDTDSKLGKMFLRTFDGKLDDIEAIKSEWAEVAPAAKTAPVETSTSTSEQTADTSGAQTQGETAAVTTATEATGSAERQALADGSQGQPGAKTGNLREELRGMAQEAIQRGATWEEGAGGLLHGLIAGAIGGEVPLLERDGRRPVGA